MEGTGLTRQDVLDATDITLAWLVERGVQADLLGVVGFDLGGTAALVVASHRKLGAAVSVGGQGVGELPALVEIAGKLTSPWLGMYGDPGDEKGEIAVARLRDAAASAGVVTNVVRYPGANHRFDADPGAAAEAWQRTLNWFDAHLQSALAGGTGRQVSSLGRWWATAGLASACDAHRRCPRSALAP
jgi:carboxymethylenebutenolidase